MNTEVKENARKPQKNPLGIFRAFRVVSVSSVFFISLPEKV
jgi:hypothetical protein